MITNAINLIKICFLLAILLVFIAKPIYGQQSKTDSTRIDTIYTRVDFGEIEEVKEAEKETDDIDEKDTDYEKDDDDDNHHDGLHITFGNNKWKFNDGTDLRLGLLDVGFSTYLYNKSLNLPSELDQFELLYDGSLNFDLHVVRHRIPIAKDHASIEYGLSFSFMQYKFANDFKILPNQAMFQIVNDGTSYKKNKLKTTFLELPVMLTLTPGRRKSFYLSGGGYAGIMLSAKQKLKTESGEKIKIKDDFNMNKFRYGIVGRVGVGPIAFYAKYSLTTLFKADQGPELYPFNVGISLLNF